MNIKLRNDYGISDEDFDKVSEPFNNDLDSWFLKHRDLIEDFTAFYIASGIKHNALWEGSFSGLINSAVDTLAGFFVDINLNRERLNKILADKYDLKVVEDNPMKFKKIGQKNSPAIC